MTKHTQQLVLMLVIGTLIGFALVKVFSAPSPHEESLNSTPAGTEVAKTEEIIKPAETITGAKHFPLPPAVPQNTRVGLSVADQAAGRMVTVSDVAVDVVSWIAVYETTDGAPGSILGAAKVWPITTSTTVELLRPEGTKSGQSYYAIVLPDNGDGEFNRLNDLPPFSSERVSVVTFKAL